MKSEIIMQLHCCKFGPVPLTVDSHCLQMPRGCMLYCMLCGAPSKQCIADPVLHASLLVSHAAV